MKKPLVKAGKQCHKRLDTPQIVTRAGRDYINTSPALPQLQIISVKERTCNYERNR